MQQPLQPNHASTKHLIPQHPPQHPQQPDQNQRRQDARARSVPHGDAIRVRTTQLALVAPTAGRGVSLAVATRSSSDGRGHFGDEVRLHDGEGGHLFAGAGGEGLVELVGLDVWKGDDEKGVGRSR